MLSISSVSSFSTLECFYRFSISSCPSVLRDRFDSVLLIHSLAHTKPCSMPFFLHNMNSTVNEKAYELNR